MCTVMLRADAKSCSSIDTFHIVKGAHDTYLINNEVVKN